MAKRRLETSVRSRQGEIVTSPAEVVDCLQDSWNELFNQTTQPTWPPFQEQFASYLNHHPCNLKDITAEQIRHQIQKIANHRAVAADGWRVHEMKQLPLGILQLVAERYHGIEQGQAWPQINCLGCISCLPKTELDVTNPKLESGILAPDAFDTRPISNISPWTTIYSGLRFKQMAEWRENWLPASMHGARCKHETNDVAYELQLLLEYSSITHDHVAGIAFDRRKFFDLLPHDICFNILSCFGAPHTILTAERAFYSQFQCLYKANGAMSSQVRGRNNGFIQGCSFSLQASLALLSIWTRYIEDCMSPQATISSGGFLDDNNFRSVAATAPAAVALLQIAWERSQRFDTLAGIQINLSKTVCFGNTPQVRKLICNQFCIEPFNLKLVNSFLLVGGMITTHGRTDKIARENRVSKALARLKRGRYAPLAFNQRVLMTQTAILPVALYGCELHPLNKTEKEPLRRRVSSCLYKGHYWCRSPAENFSFALPGHRLDAVQAAIYHTLHVARRIFLRRPELFLYYQKNFDHLSKGHTSIGPINNLFSAVTQLKCEWTSPTILVHQTGVSLNLLAASCEWSHTVRSFLRYMVWTEKAFQNRLDMVDADPCKIDYESTVALARAMQKG